MLGALGIIYENVHLFDTLYSKAPSKVVPKDFELFGIGIHRRFLFCFIFKGFIRSDFLLVPGDLISNVKLIDIIQQHK